MEPPENFSALRIGPAKQFSLSQRDQIYALFGAGLGTKGSWTVADFGKCFQ